MQNDDPNGTCPEGEAIQFMAGGWTPRRIAVPGGYAIAVTTPDGGMVLMPVQAARQEPGPDPAFQRHDDAYSIVRQQLLQGRGTAMVTGQPSTRRCCDADRSDAVLVKTWTADYMQHREDGMDPDYLPILFVAVDAHNGKTASAVLDVEDAKQLQNRIGEAIRAAEQVAGRI